MLYIFSVRCGFQQSCPALTTYSLLLAGLYMPHYKSVSEYIHTYTPTEAFRALLYLTLSICTVSGYQPISLLVKSVFGMSLHKAGSNYQSFQTAHLFNAYCELYFICFSVFELLLYDAKPSFSVPSTLARVAAKTYHPRS